MTVAIGSTVDTLIAALKEATSPDMVSDRVEGALANTYLNDLDLAPYLYFESGRYTRNLIYRDECFELLVLCWDGGAHSAIHDHGGSRCFMVAQRGTFVVEEYVLLEGGKESGHARLAAGTSRVVLPGELDVRTPENDVHRVIAPNEPSVSLHVYAKALDRCLVFDKSLSSSKTVSNRYDTIRMFRNNRMSA